MHREGHHFGLPSQKPFHVSLQAAPAVWEQVREPAEEEAWVIQYRFRGVHRREHAGEMGPRMTGVVAW